MVKMMLPPKNHEISNPAPGVFPKPFYGTYMYIVDAYFVILKIASVTFGT